MRLLLTCIATMLTLSAFGQDIDSLEVDKEASLQNVTITSRRSGTRRMGGAVNGVLISRDELFKAACCNLGESFTTNPSVDVNYSDAATGAKQIKLLGLSGTYVQMLTENLPNFRGAAAPYALDYVPGPWMNSIQVSKGSSSYNIAFVTTLLAASTNPIVIYNSESIGISPCSRATIDVCNMIPIPTKIRFADTTGVECNFLSTFNRKIFSI